MSGYVNGFVCNIITMPYPIYASFKAIESTGKDDDTQWLTFWVVWAAVALVESGTDLFMWWIPFYWEVKLIAFLLLQAPLLNLSASVYTGFVRPWLVARQDTFDHLLANAARACLSWVLSSMTRAIGFLSFLRVNQTTQTIATPRVEQPVPQHAQGEVKTD